MDIKIRAMAEKDRRQVKEMMRVFYASDAISSNGSEEIFDADIDYCIGDSPYAEGYVFESERSLAGYGMAAKSFSTEFGKPCVWIEDIYVKDEYRGHGVGSFFLAYMEEKYPQALFRLEVDAGNERALRVYTKCGYDTLPYVEMKKQPNSK